MRYAYSRGHAGLVFDQAITIHNGRRGAEHFQDYPITKDGLVSTGDLHQYIKTNQWISGLGEEVVPFIAPAVCNAIHAGTGKRHPSITVGRSRSQLDIGEPYLVWLLIRPVRTGRKCILRDDEPRQEDGTMSGLASRPPALLLVGVLVFIVCLPVGLAAQPGYVPVLQDGPRLWQHPFGGVFPAVKGSALPVQQDPRRLRVAGRTWHIADLSNPNLMPWAKDIMEKEIEAIDAGKIQFTAGSSCLPTGVPNFLQDGGPFLFVQGLDKVVIVDEAGPVVRHVYLNVAHTPNVKPSWMGESIGWYEGDTLVVDTIGFNNKSFVDRFGTPHTEKLHVVERWRVIDQGLTLRVDVEVEDSGTFYQPWKTFQVYRRIDRGFEPEICAENNRNLFDYGTPQDDSPDF